MTSSTPSNGMTVMTGPKISSRAMVMSLLASAKIVGGTKYPPARSPSEGASPCAARVASFCPISM